MKALVIGATGATGKDLVSLLLQEEQYEQVDIFVRRDPAIHHPKLKVHIVDFNHIEQWQNLLQGDVLFSAMGTTRKQAGSKEAQWIIDYDYQYNTVQAAKENGVQTLELVSSINANAQSSLFYPRMKGALEDAVLALGFPKVVILRPPSLIRKGTDRFGEPQSVAILQFLNKFGILKSWEPMPTEMVAQAMIQTSLDHTPGHTILEAADIRGQIGNFQIRHADFTK